MHSCQARLFAYLNAFKLCSGSSRKVSSGAHITRLFTMANTRVWFVTGTSSGIGRCLVEQILKRGDIAVATLRKPSELDIIVQKYPSSQLLVLKCDVTNYDEVKSAFTRAVRTFKRIDVVVNNAGISLVGEAEGTPENFARKLFEVNFWAAANVSREAVRIFREISKEEKGRFAGKLLNISSTAGIVGAACSTYYGASKHALEGFTEGLRKEIDPEWNISISIIELGAFRTKGVKETTKLPIHPAYDRVNSPAWQSRAFLDVFTANMPGDPDRAAAKIFDFAGLEKPPSSIILGEGAGDYVIQKLDSLKEEIQAYKSWSEGLNFPS